MAATYGFEFRYRMCGKPPTILDLICAIGTGIKKGDLLEVGTTTAGQVDIAATADVTLIGVANETIAAADMTAASTKIKVIVDADAVYEVTDANARVIGAALDVSGGTGAMTVTTKSNDEFVVMADSSATEDTLVMIHPKVRFEYGAT